jgi:hypothetical protein
MTPERVHRAEVLALALLLLAGFALESRGLMFWSQLVKF